jgi:hypothetical protein
MMLPPEKHEEDLVVLLRKVIVQAMEDYSGLLPIRYRPKRALGRALYESHLVFSSSDFVFKYFLDDEERPMNIEEALKRTSSSARASLGVLRKHLKTQAKALIAQEVQDMLKVPDIVVIAGSPYKVVVSTTEPYNIDFERHIITLNDSDKGIDTAMLAFVSVMLEESEIKARFSSIKTFARLMSEFLALNGNIFFSRDVSRCRPIPPQTNDQEEED